jgi:hypothetical protein
VIEEGFRLWIASVRIVLGNENSERECRNYETREANSLVKAAERRCCFNQRVQQSYLRLQTLTVAFQEPRASSI